MVVITYLISCSIYLPDYVVHVAQEKTLRVSVKTRQCLPILVEHRVSVFQTGREGADAILAEDAILDVGRIHCL